MCSLGTTGIGYLKNKCDFEEWQLKTLHVSIFYTIFFALEYALIF